MTINPSSCDRGGTAAQRRYCASLTFSIQSTFLPLRFLRRDVRRGGVGRSAVPVLLAGWKPHHISGPDFLDRPAFCLQPIPAVMSNV